MFFLCEAPLIIVNCRQFIQLTFCITKIVCDEYKKTEQILPRLFVFRNPRNTDVCNTSTPCRGEFGGMSY